MAKNTVVNTVRHPNAQNTKNPGIIKRYTFAQFVNIIINKIPYPAIAIPKLTKKIFTLLKNFLNNG